MANKKAKQREDSNKRILEAARAQIAELGYEAASAQSIAEKAGVTKGLVLTRFGGKEGLLRQVIKEEVQNYVEVYYDIDSFYDVLMRVIYDIKVGASSKSLWFEFLCAITTDKASSSLCLQILKEELRGTKILNAVQEAIDSKLLDGEDPGDLFLAFVKSALYVSTSYLGANLPLPDDAFYLNLIRFQRDDITQEHQIRLREEEESKNRLNIIYAISDEFDYVCVIDAVKNEVVTYHEAERIKKIVEDVPDFIPSNKKLDTLFNRVVAPSHLDEFRKETERRFTIEKLAKDVIYTIETVFHIEGRDQYYRIKFVNTNDMSGNVIMGIQNIDEEVRAEMERNQQANTIKSMTLIQALADDFDVIYYVNPVTEEYTTMSRTKGYMHLGTESESNFFEAIRITAPAVVHPDDLKRVFRFYTRENLIQTMIVGEVKYLDLRQKLDTDEYRWNRNKVTKILDGSGKERLVVGVLDITYEKDRMRELEEARKNAEAANAAKTNFLFNMSHDIRTPMNAIIGYTDMALRSLDNKEKVQSCLKKIGTSSDHLLDLISEVLDMSRIESGKLSIVESVVDIRVKEANVSLIMGELAKEKGVELVFHEVKHKYPYVTADGTHVDQVIINIISNAIKYTPKGGTVHHFLEELPSGNDGYIIKKFVTKDTGIGMSEEFLARLFEPFSREQSSTVSGIEGTGLGMSIVKRLLELMNGTIEVESEVGKGTTVTVCIPFKIAEEKDCISEETIEGDDEESIMNKRVLLVEDNEMNREIAKEILEQMGLIVEEVVDGDLAVEKMKEVDNDYYDIILMDVQMPRMNGYEATKAIRRIEGLENIPIIAMTANAFNKDKEDAIEAGMNDHLSKPINIANLKRKIKQYTS